MLKIFSRIFHVVRKEHEPKVEAGQKWQLHVDGDPFPSKYLPVKIIDAREGWVRYDMGGMFDDQRMRESTFLSMYRKVTEQPTDSAALRRIATD